MELNWSGEISLGGYSIMIYAAYLFGMFITDLPIVCILYGITKFILIKTFGNSFRNTYISLLVTLIIYSLLRTYMKVYDFYSVITLTFSLILILLVELYLHKRHIKKSLSD